MHEHNSNLQQKMQLYLVLQFTKNTNYKQFENSGFT